MIENVFKRKRVTALFVVLAMALSCLAGIIPVGGKASADDSAIQAKIDTLLQTYGNDKYFSRNGLACTHGQSEGCDNCNLINIPARNGLPAGKEVLNYDRHTCVAFATYVYYYIFGHNDTVNTTVLPARSTPQLGDIIITSGHWSICAGQKDADNWYIYEANYVTPSRIQYKSPYTVVNRNSIQKVYHSNNYDNVSGGSASVEKGTLMTSGAGRTIPDGDYHIVSYADSSYGLAAVDTTANESTNIHLWKDMESDNHVFTITYLNNNFYKIIHKKTGLSLDVEGASEYRRANIQLYEENGYTEESDGFVSLPGPAQQWSIAADVDGSFTIRSRKNGFYLDITDAAIENGTNIMLWSRTEPIPQNWRFIPYVEKPIQGGRYYMMTEDNKYISNAVLGSKATVSGEKNTVNFTFRSKSNYYEIHTSKRGESGGYFIDNTGASNVKYDYTSTGWIVRKNGDGYEIISRLDGTYLDVNSYGELVTVTYGGQKWRLESLPISERLRLDFDSYGAYLFENMTSITYGETLTGASRSNLDFYQLKYWDYDKENMVELPGKFVWDDPTIKPAVADSYKTKYKFRFIPDDMEKYGEIEYESYTSVKVVPAEYPEDAPSTEMKPAANIKKVGDIKLSENWKWDEADANTVLKDDTPITATAVYTGEDGGAGNFVNESVTVTITRSSCTHPENKQELRGKIEPDCTNDGYTGDTYCSECDTVIEKGSSVKASGHKYGSWKMTTAPTCTEDGVLEAKCSVCSDVLIQSIDALGHNISKTEAAEATCTSSGSIEHWSCETCGKLFSSESGTDEITLEDVVIPAAGHKEDGGTADPQTGTTIFRCTVCKAVIREENSFILGDVNHDGHINNTDIILLGRAYMAGDGAKYLAVADMNNDGYITNADIILLGRLYMTGK